MMNKHIKNYRLGVILMIFTWLGTALPVFAQTSPPVVFYLDLLSGPKTGGEGNNGVILTISGKNFGVVQGTSTVAVGGGSVAAYKTWSDTKVQVAVGATAATGFVVVTVNGKSSTCANVFDGCNFTVRSGNIYYVSGSGNDSNNGSFASPFRTLTHARGVLAAGDTVYAMNGSDLSSNDGGGWHAAFTLGTDLMPAGTAANPIAFVVYPANSVTIGSTTGADVQYGIRTKASGNHYVVFSGFVLTDAGTSGAIEVNDNGWRIVNNTITCPKSNGATGCIFLNGGTSGHYVYGNDVSQSGKLVTSSKLFHQIYVQSNSTWVGWNQVHDNFTCRGIQFHNSSGPNEFDLHVFNNLIYNDPCDGINFATVDPSKGTVEAFNNVIYHVGAGPDPADGAANSACIYSADITNAGSPGSGAIKIYNNTMYDCGSHSPFSGSAGAIVKNGSASSLTINATGNIFQQLSGEGYINGATGQISGDRNIWFGSGSGPTSGFTNNINSNPLLANVPTRDFHVLLGSPAIGAAAASPVPARDYDGNVRPAPASVGAFELSGTGSVSRPNPPTNLTIVVG